jgi:ribosomal protein S8E
LLYCLKYTGLEILEMDESYAEDFIIDEELRIRSLGNVRPIYEIEKYDRKLISQFSTGFSQRIEWALENYPDVTYSVVNDYDSKIVNIEVKDYKISDKNAIQEIIENCLNESFVELGEIMDGYIINITFEQSDIIRNSDNDNIGSSRK